MSPNDGTAALAGLFAFLLIVGLFWVLPVTVGIKAAHKRNRSPHWMWFGIHPVGGYIMMIIMLCLSPLKVCRNCGQKAKSFARVCPYCQESFTPSN